MSIYNLLNADVYPKRKHYDYHYDFLNAINFYRIRRLTFKKSTLWKSIYPKYLLYRRIRYYNNTKLGIGF